MTLKQFNIGDKVKIMNMRYYPDVSGQIGTIENILPNFMHNFIIRFNNEEGSFISAFKKDELEHVSYFNETDFELI
jgi:hypothetical protein